MAEVESERDGPHLPSIENGVYKRTSVSQIRTFKHLCQVAWGFDKIEHIPRGPDGAGVIIGKQGHKENEFFLKEGCDVRGPIARAGASMLEPYAFTFPFKGGGGLVEQPLSEPTIRTPGGVEFVGYIDYTAALSESLALVVDHKFKKSLAKYGTTVEELENDEQAIVYGFWALMRFRARRVKFELHQYQHTGKHIFKAVSIEFDRDELGDKFVSLLSYVDHEIAPAAKATRARDLQPNTGSCAKYGGCSYAQICPYSPRNRFLSSLDQNWQPPAAVTAIKKEVSTMGLLDVVTGAAGLPAGTPPPSGVNAVTAALAAALPKIPAMACKAENAYLLADGKAATFKVAMNGVYYFLRDGQTLQLQAGNEVSDLGGAAAVATPPLVIQAAPPTPPAPPAVAVLPPDAPASNPTGAAAPPVIAATPPPAQTAPPAAAAEEPSTKGKRGRPAGSKNGYTLFIDCATNFETTDLNPLVASYARQLAEKSGLPDIRLAPKKAPDNTDHPLAFGGWRAVLSMAILNNLPSGFCSINSSELNEPVIEALSGAPTCAGVVRGGK